MPEWINDLLVAIGGGSVVLVGTLTIFKNLFLKMFETGIETSFERSMEKYRNQLSRSTKAYEILLEREMRYYERMEPIYAELVPLIQDLHYYLKKDDENDRTKQCDAFGDCFHRYTDIIKIMKNETLIHQTYIPEIVFVTSTLVVTHMQSNLDYWLEMGKKLFDGKYEEIDYDKAECVVDEVLLHIVKSELAIKKRLEELSGI